MDEKELVSLAELAAGHGVRVVRVSDDNPEMLRYLGELSIMPGAEILIVSKAPFGGPISLRIGREIFSIGPDLAAQVMVEPIVDADAPAH